jgi:hypothetical protein
MWQIQKKYSKLYHVSKKKNQFYTLAVIAFGGPGLAAIGYGDHGLAAKFHDTQDLFLKTLIANWSQGSCHLPW